MSGWVRQSVRFGMVGLLNTAIGLGAIYAMIFFFGAGAAVANAVGYAIGQVVSFALNRIWTFGDRRQISSVLPRYLLVVGLSYVLNLAAVLLAAHYLGAGPYLAQLFGVALYTVTSFVGCKLFVYDSSAKSTASWPKEPGPGWLLAVCLGVFVRGLWMLFVHPEPIADYAFYFTRAEGLANGSGYLFQHHPTAFFPVGTSLILAGPFALFGKSLAVAQVLSLLAWAATIALTYQLGRLLLDSRAALIAALIVALHPDLVAFSALVASENFFLPCLLGCIHAFCLARPCDTRGSAGRTGLYALAGVLFGIALLIRSTALILLPALAMLIVWEGRRQLRSSLLQASIFASCSALVLAPWVIRNAVQMGGPLLTTNGGVSLWWGNNPQASGGFPLSGEMPVQNLATVNDEVANNRHYSALAFAFIREQPGAWLGLIPAKFGFLFSAASPDIGYSLRHRYVAGPDAIEHHPRLGDGLRPEDAVFVERPLGPVESRVIGAYYHLAGGFMGNVWQGGLWGAGCIGFALLGWRRRRQAQALLPVLLVPAAWVLFHITLGNGQPRYLLSVVPFVLLGAAELLSWLVDLARNRAPSSRRLPSR